MMTGTDTILQLTAVSHRYANKLVVKEISLQLARGTIGCLLGPSACGKTTILRGIAGFEAVSTGEIRLNGTVVSRVGYTLAPEQRHIGMVFQDYALFPHLTCARNVGFGLQQLSRHQYRERVAQLLHMVGLSDVANRYPAELSGGQQQRVALARALAPNPQLLLLDEPFSNLDIDLRERLSVEVREILKRHHTTAIMVTHDQNEAYAMADEIGIIHAGELQQWNTPYDLYHRPINRFVADFVGQGVFMPGTVVTSSKIEIELGIFQGQFEQAPGTVLDVLIRPDDLVHDDASAQTAVVVKKVFRGADFLYTLQLPSGHQLISLVPSHHDHAVGSAIGIRLDLDHVVVFDRDAV